jgi:hypothetical protein
MNSNLDEGILYADYQFASMSDSKEIKQAFNKFYNMNPDEQYYIEVE